jgi:hypothetical protein
MPPQPDGRAAAVADVDAVRGRFPEASHDRRLAGTNENPVLIAVLAAAFIGERTTLRRTIGVLMGIARSAGDHRVTEPAGLEDGARGRRVGKGLDPRKRTCWARPSAPSITA